MAKPFSPMRATTLTTFFGLLAAVSVSPGSFAQIYLNSSPECTGSTFSKQSCSFRGVCFQPNGHQSITVVWQGSEEGQRTLRAHVGRYLQGVYPAVDYNSSLDVSAFEVDYAVTMLWRVFPGNQQSFGHALVNEVFPIFMVLSNQFQAGVPRRLQLLVTADWLHHVLKNLISETITHETQLFKRYLGDIKTKSGVCFRHIIIGDGGYIDASRASLANSNRREAHQFAAAPSFFNSKNWWAFRQHALQVAGVEGADTQVRPLVVLNDKRHAGLRKDRRLIMDIERIAANISAAFPQAIVTPVRFRDLVWPEQLQWLVSTKVFITTQGSSAFRLVFLPKGATCIVVGSPSHLDEKEWAPFHELDRWFPLSYISVVRYQVSLNNTHEYDASSMGGWRPDGGADAERRWDLYNAAIRLNVTRVGQILATVLSSPK